ncbi:MAG: T9SS type A sorting domain-containing protein [Bacteroidales bacterium]|nr:T9SS type A sorting domain-containing protein [Bacteroidales bacterium]
MKKRIFTFLAIVFAIGLFAQTDIMPPELVAPTDGKENQMPDVTLDWNAVSGIGQVTYEVELDTDDQFPNPQEFITDVSSVTGDQLFFGTVYYWRVNATDNTGTSDWSEVFTFKTFDEVLLNKPNDGATDQMPNVKLEWKKQANMGVIISGIYFYDFEISEDTSFNNIVMSEAIDFSTFTNADNFHYGYASQLMFNTEYFWHVRARHEMDSTEWSERRSFTTIEKVILVDPPDGAIDQMLDVILHWEEVTGTFGYMYELCTDPNFGMPCMNIVDTNAVATNGLAFGETYYWRVKSYHNLDTTDWSESWSFETVNTIALVLPENEATIPDLLPQLEWLPVTGITNYEVEYDISENFTDPETNLIAPAENFFQIQYVLEVGTTYYWRVRAIQDGDTSNWSPTWNFTVNTSGIYDQFLNEANLSIYPNPSSGMVNVKFEPATAMNIEISVHDILGQVFYKENTLFSMENTSRSINLDKLSEGIYIIIFRHGEIQVAQKLIIDR